MNNQKVISKIYDNLDKKKLQTIYDHIQSINIHFIYNNIAFIISPSSYFVMHKNYFTFYYNQQLTKKRINKHNINIKSIDCDPCYYNYEKNTLNVPHDRVKLINPKRFSIRIIYCETLYKSIMFSIMNHCNKSVLNKILFEIV